jgi:hypothetical protein
MTIKVIGAGLGRTGTMSLKLALERLGFNPCYHMFEVMQGGDMREARIAQWDAISRGEMLPWREVFAGYHATVDWPACNYWRELMAEYPDAKVILSRRRTAEQWFRSTQATIMHEELQHPPFIDRLIEAIVGPDPHDPVAVPAAYEAHNAAVIAAVPPEKLLVFEPGDGWAPLCAFLGVPVPDEPYPQVNSTAEFQAMVAGMRAELAKLAQAS